MNHNRIVTIQIILFPDRLKYIFRRYHFTGIFTKKPQYFKFCRRRIYRFIIERHDMAFLIDKQSFYFDYIFVYLMNNRIFFITSKLCFYPCHKFRHMKWLSHIIICANRQSGYLISIFYPCGQHNNRIGIFFSNPAT